MKKYLDLFGLNDKIDYKTEILAGLTVSMALIPEAVAFAMIAGLSPLTGLYAAFMMGLVTSIIGGRPGMIRGNRSHRCGVGCAGSISRSGIYIRSRDSGRYYSGSSRCAKAW